MSRLAVSLAVLLAAMAAPAYAADWLDDGGDDPAFRDSFSIEPKDWNEVGDETDGVHFETGIRYWYSMGSQSSSFANGDTFEKSDTAHSVEAHIRIEDDATSTYGKGWVGYSAAIGGTYSDNNGTGDVVDGVLGYAGADFGWNAFSDNKGTGAGGFVGYNYWNNSPRTTRTNFTTATGEDEASYYSPETGIWSLPGDSVDDKLELHMLRLGVSGKAEITDFLDLSAEVAAVPFTTINGVTGGHDAGFDGTLGPFPGCGLGDPCPVYTFKGSETTMNGWGYGAMAELMAGITPIENLTLRLGGRAWYVNGTYDASWREVEVVPPVEQPPEGDPPEQPDPLYSPPNVSSYEVIETANPISLLRYGLLAELTYKF